MSMRVFKTLRGRIILTDETLTYEDNYERPWRVSHRVRTVARADITEVHVITHVHWFAPTWVEIIVRYTGGVLNMKHVALRTAEGLRATLGF
jgi:hypothetical protein